MRWSDLAPTTNSINCTPSVIAFRTRTRTNTRFNSNGFRVVKKLMVPTACALWVYWFYARAVFIEATTSKSEEISSYGRATQCRTAYSLFSTIFQRICCVQCTNQPEYCSDNRKIHTSQPFKLLSNYFEWVRVGIHYNQIMSNHSRVFMFRILFLNGFVLSKNYLPCWFTRWNWKIKTHSK